MSAPSADQPTDGRVAPRGGLLVRQAHQDGNQRAREQRRADVVDLGSFAGQVVQRQVAPDQVEHERADREIEEEHERPTDRVREESTDRRTHQDGDTEDGPEQSLVSTAFGRREQVADDRERDREQRTGAEALDASGGDQLPHLLRESGEQRAEHEHADPEQEDRAPTEQVGQLAVQRSADRGRQQVGRERPGVEVVPAKVGDDRRQSRPDDGLIEGGEEDSDHDGAEDTHPHGMRQLDGRAIVGSERRLALRRRHVGSPYRGDVGKPYQGIRSISFLIPCYLPVMGTSARLLRLLSLLQTPRDWTGTELAERLEVSPRTVRNDIERLRDLGYPVHATRGSIGGYRLIAGATLPPLLLEDDEAVALAVGLRTAAGGAVTGIEESSLRALAKLEQVLPDPAAPSSQRTAVIHRAARPAPRADRRPRAS